MSVVTLTKFTSTAISKSDSNSSKEVKAVLLAKDIYRTIDICGLLMELNSSEEWCFIIGSEQKQF
jgi:hypothetical protein